MMAAMKYRLMSWYVALAVLLVPLVARAADEEELVTYEARLEGYATPVLLPGGGNTLTAMMIIFLSVLALCTLLKNPKRSHLD
jgi:hypothetical protein